MKPPLFKIPYFKEIVYNHRFPLSPVGPSLVVYASSWEEIVFPLEGKRECTQVRKEKIVHRAWVTAHQKDLDNDG